MRLTTRSEYASSSLAPRTTSSTTATAEVTSAMTSAEPKLSTWNEPGNQSDASLKIERVHDQDQQEVDDERQG